MEIYILIKTYFSSSEKRYSILFNLKILSFSLILFKYLISSNGSLLPILLIVFVEILRFFIFSSLLSSSFLIELSSKLFSLLKFSVSSLLLILFLLFEFCLLISSIWSVFILLFLFSLSFFSLSLSYDNSSFIFCL